MLGKYLRLRGDGEAAQDKQGTSSGGQKWVMRPMRRLRYLVRVKTTDHAITCVVCYPTFTHLPRGYAVQAEAWSEMTREAAAAGAATSSKGNVGSTLGVEVEEFEAEDDDEGEAEDECGDEASDAEAMPTREMVLVVQKIDSLRVKERVAVFWLVLPPDPDEAPEEPLVLHAHDLSRPVTTFASVVESPDCTWVPVDVYWAGAGSSTGPPSIHVRLLQLALDCISCDFYQVTFILNRIAQASEMSPSPLLLSTLNGVSAIPGAATCIYPPLRSDAGWQLPSARSPCFSCTNPSRASRKTSTRLTTRSVTLRTRPPRPRPQLQGSATQKLRGRCAREWRCFSEAWKLMM